MSPHSAIYPITDIFVSEQGEGHFVGYRMAFVRLAGCSVSSCYIRSECDEAPWKATGSYRAIDIVETVKAVWPSGIVCITGGEPTDHNLVPLVYGLRDAGYRVHLETSGYRSVEGMPLDWITVSPKTAGYAQRQGHTLKLVVRPDWGDADQCWEHISSFADCTAFFHYYLQPLYQGNQPLNLEQVQACLRHIRNGGGKWALSCQAHKHWGVK